MQIFFQKGMPDGYEQTYPVTEDNLPPENARVASPMVGKTEGLKPPTREGDEGYEEMVAETILVRQQTIKREWPKAFLEKYGIDPVVPEPLRPFVGRTPDPQKAADIVEMDKPDDLARILIDWIGMKRKREGRMNEAQWILFLEENITDLAICLNSVLHNGLYPAFRAKWFYGASRPEERVPLGNGWTHYETGCPPHPRYPAGHGGASGATAQCLITEIFSDLDDDEKEVILQTCAHFSFYRTFSGMHDAEDNLAGLALSPVMVERFPAVAAQLAQAA